MIDRRHLSPSGRSVVVALGALLAACNSPPSGEGEPPLRDPSVPGCINACYYDELPPPVDCAAAEAGVEFYPLSIWSMDRGGVASNLYLYWDATAPHSYLVPGAWEAPANATLDYPGGVNETWPGDPIPEAVKNVPRCEGQSVNNVLHLFGGPFTEWGGGVGRGMKCLNQTGDGSLGKVKVGFDTMKPNTDVTDLSCGTGPDTNGAPALGACNPSLETDTDVGKLVRSACPARDLKAQAEGPASAGDEEFLLGQTLDVSAWDGISFWARRSPNSQAGIRVAVGDKRTDDDLRYQQYHVNPDATPFCERTRECGCLNSRPCTELTGPTAGASCTEDAQCNRGNGTCDTTVGRCQCTRDQECPSGWCEYPSDAVYGTTLGYCRAMSYCYDPAVDPIPESWFSAGGERVFPPCTTDADCTGDASCQETPSGGQRVCWAPGDPKPVNKFTISKCGEPACNAFYEPFQVGDEQFNGRACTPFSFRGSTTNSFCFDPGVDPDPAEGNEHCGDFWLAPVRLSTEWKFYKIPFNELHQQGWAKEQFEFDLTSVSVVRFTWDRGWVDYWLDDVRFYREKR